MQPILVDAAEFRGFLRLEQFSRESKQCIKSGRSAHVITDMLFFETHYLSVRAHSVYVVSGEGCFAVQHDLVRLKLICNPTHVTWVTCDRMAKSQL